MSTDLKYLAIRHWLPTVKSAYWENLDLIFRFRWFDFYFIIINSENVIFKRLWLFENWLLWCGKVVITEKPCLSSKNRVQMFSLCHSKMFVNTSLTYNLLCMTARLAQLVLTFNTKLSLHEDDGNTAYNLYVSKFISSNIKKVYFNIRT